jgi:hypothetical protein
LIKRGAYTAAEMNSQLVDLGDDRMDFLARIDLILRGIDSPPRRISMRCLVKE